jgi:hypothetical protein
MDARLPARLEALALLRLVQTQGGFGTVIHKGDADSGSILVVLTENGTNSRVYERLPSVEGDRIWVLAKKQDAEDTREFSEYLDRRAQQDPDSWIIELDVADAQRFIAETTATG